MQERYIAPLRCVVGGFFYVANANRPEKIAFEQSVTANIGNLNLAAFAADAHVAGSIGYADIAFLELDSHIRTGVVNLDVAILRGGGDGATDSGNLDIAASAQGGKRDAFRQLYIEIDRHIAASPILVQRVNEIAASGMLDHHSNFLHLLACRGFSRRRSRLIHLDPDFVHVAGMN